MAAFSASRARRDLVRRSLMEVFAKCKHPAGFVVKSELITLILICSRRWRARMARADGGGVFLHDCGSAACSRKQITPTIVTEPAQSLAIALDDRLWVGEHLHRP